MQPEARQLTGPIASHRGDIALKTLFVVLCCAALYFRLEIFLWLPLWPLVGAAALTWGGWEERAGFLAFLTTLGATRQIFGLKAPSAGVILVDAAFLVALAVIALRSRRWWPSWAAAFQFAAVAARLLFLRPGLRWSSANISSVRRSGPGSSSSRFRSAPGTAGGRGTATPSAAAWRPLPSP